jgi:hypothetical protein
MKQNLKNSELTNSDLSKNDAESVAISINLLFNNTKLFGSKHPSTEQAAMDLSQKVSKFAEKSSLITFLKSGKSFYVEKWVADNKINLARFTQDFGRLNIESVSFLSGVSPRNLLFFAEVYANALENQSNAGFIQSVLNSREQKGVVINYVTFQKVTKDDKIVSASDIVLKNVEETASRPEIPTNVISHLEKLFDIKNAIENDSYPEKAPDFNYINSELNLIKSKIDEDKIDGKIDYDLLFNSLTNISKIVKNTNYFVNNEEKKSVISKIDKMTIEAILEIIKDEIKKDGSSVKKLVYLITRLSVSKEQLRLMLPQIKAAMLKANFDMSDYLDFVMETTNKLSGEETVDKIFETASDHGVKSSEIIEAFSQNPEEIIKLLLQSAEIQKHKIHGTNLSDYLSKILDETSEGKKAENHKDSLGNLSEKFNLTSEEITNILENVRRQKDIMEKRKDLQLLPPKTTVYFIKRYIEEYKRHKNPFSIIAVSDKIKDSQEGVLSISENIAYLLTKGFRFLDISGFVNIRGKNIAIIILPMTGKDGLEVILERISNQIDVEKHILSSFSLEESGESQNYESVMKKLLRKHV